MSYKAKFFLFGALIFIFLIFLLTMVCYGEVDRRARFDIDGSIGDDFIGQASILYPLRNSEDSIVYSDLRYRVGSDDPEEWNIGLGYRRKFSDRDNALAGVYLFRDRRDEYDNYWDMWTIGGEILTDQWDFRVNAYLSDDDKVLAAGSENANNELLVNNEQQLIFASSGAVYYKSMDGVDLEVGRRLRERDDFLNNVGAYLRVFRFSADEMETMTGQQLRIDKLIGERDDINYKFGVDWQNDNLRDSETKATFSVSIPFGGSSDSKESEERESEMTADEVLEARMTEKPVRDLDIIISETEEDGEIREERIAVDPLTGEEIGTVYFVTDDGDGDGSEDNPTKLSDLNSEEHDLIILSGEINYDQLILSEGQKLISAETGELEVSDGNGSTAVFAPDGNSATLKGEPSENDALLKLNNMNTVSGLRMEIESNGDYKRQIAIIIEDSSDTDKFHIIKDNTIDSANIGIAYENDEIDLEEKYEAENTFNSVDLKSLDGQCASDDSLIVNWHELDNVREDLTKDYELVNNLNEDVSGYDEHASENANDDKGWNPIGADSVEFVGVFDGNDYVISDLYIDREGENYIGLFSEIDSAGEIKNLGLADVYITGDDYVGGLVGRNDGTIENISIKDVDITGDKFVGGLVGYNHNGTIENISIKDVDISGKAQFGGLVGINYQGTIYDSYVTGEEKITGDDHVGGLVGINYQGTIYDSYVRGDVDITGEQRVGGLVGYNNFGEIINSHATGSVTATERRVGGLVGQNSGGTIEKSYADVDVEAENSDEIRVDIGGLVGHNSGTIEQSYAEGLVKGSNDSDDSDARIEIGGLVGRNQDATIKNSYATGDVELVSAGDNVEVNLGGLVGKNRNNHNPPKIENSYAIGEINGGNSEEHNLGGLVGYNNKDGSDKPEIIDSFALDNSLEIIGEDEGELTGRVALASEDDLKGSNLYRKVEDFNSYDNLNEAWDENIWDFGSDEDYPILEWQD